MIFAGHGMIQKSSPTSGKYQDQLFICQCCKAGKGY